MHTEINSGYLILQTLKDISNKPIFKLQTKRYRPNYLSNDEANGLGWSEFLTRSPLIFKQDIPQTNLELAIISKSVTWSSQDANIFIGSNSREIESFLDLNLTEFTKVFEWHKKIASQLSNELERPIYVTHGFNPQDTAPDAHSLRSKFHTHIYVPDTNSEEISIASLSWFERLSFIEPFVVVFSDLVKDLILNTHKKWLIEDADGFFSLRILLHDLDAQAWEEIYRILQKVFLEYEALTSIFSNRHEEQETGYRRFVLKDKSQINEELEEYLHQNTWLSQKSIALLRYLATNITNAKPRSPQNSTNITDAKNLWIAKGPSGAINFIFDANTDSFRFDFAPRIISTSGATKILSEHPTLIIKNQGKASANEQEEMHTFEASVRGAAQRSFSESISKDILMTRNE